MNKYPLANCFGVPVFLFSPSLSTTFFPCSTAPNNDPPILIAFIGKLHHFIALELQNRHLFPAPPISQDWAKNCNPEAIYRMGQKIF
jgi:hypothetical protein